LAEVALVPAVAITPGVLYVASYHTPGNYAAGGNGVYTYSLTSKFPNGSFNASNYWVDVVFVY
jgi:hypothetical protein